jgi:hypothetical protein
VSVSAATPGDTRTLPKLDPGELLRTSFAVTLRSAWPGLWMLWHRDDAQLGQLAVESGDAFGVGVAVLLLNDLSPARAKDKGGPVLVDAGSVGSVGVVIKAPIGSVPTAVS